MARDAQVPWWNRFGGRPKHDGGYRDHEPGSRGPMAPFSGPDSGFPEGWIEDLDALASSEQAGSVRIHAHGTRYTQAPQAAEWGDACGG
jgi:hypothetical protein